MNQCCLYVVRSSKIMSHCFVQQTIQILSLIYLNFRSCLLVTFSQCSRTFTNRKVLYWPYDLTHLRACFVVFSLYVFFLGSKNLQQIPLKLLKIITRWLKDDSCLCLTSLSSPLSSRMNRWTSPNKSNTQTPTPGLVRWCVKAPLLAETSCRELNNKYDASATQQEKGDSVESCSADDTWHDLHLAVLETMLSLRSLEDAAQLELLTITDMNRIVNELLQLSSRLDRNERVLLGLDRFAQFLQISLTTGAFRCSLIDLRRICQALPKTE